MTIIFPDVSEYEGAYNFTPYPLGVARAAISNVKDREWETNKANCAAKGIRLAAYAFLNAPSLGVSVSAQAEFAHGVVGSRPCMVDMEPNRGACASFADVMTWIGYYRSLGGVCHLAYIPQWAWVSNLKMPNMSSLTDIGVGLVSSNYVPYSETGIGWRAYGGVTPIQWQFTDNLNGSGADGNAYKGTADQWWSMMTGNQTQEGNNMIVMAHEQGSNIDWAGDGIFRYKVVDSAHRANLLVMMRLQGDSNPVSVEFTPGTLDALGPIVVSASSGGFVDVEAKLDGITRAVADLVSRVPAAPTVNLTDAQVGALSAAVAQAVVGAHDALSSVDLASVQAAAETAVRNVLGGLG